MISYMGTKAKLAGDVAKAIGRLPAGPLLDLFAGMASVSKAVGQRRQAWLNDAQAFACEVNRFQFQLGGEARIDRESMSLFQSAYHWNKDCLERRYRVLLAAEAEALGSGSPTIVAECNELLGRMLASHLDLAIDDSDHGKSMPYRLFCVTHSGGYVGLAQAIEIDSLRYAIDAVKGGFQRESMVHSFLIAVLGAALRQCATTTGHFAQFLKPKPSNLRRWTAQRRLSVTAEFRKIFAASSAEGDADWRRSNHVFHGDANDLLDSLMLGQQAPSVVYADPPYTADHYSRYYHLLETLVDYKYQKVTGAGRYRPDRFASDFSTKTRVPEAFERMISSSSAIGASIVINYPEYGLMERSNQQIPDMLAKIFKRVRRPIRLAHQHSTLGASKGEERRDVSEYIYVATM